MKTASGRANVSPSAEGTTRTEKTAPAKLTRADGLAADAAEIPAPERLVSAPNL
jgi:hypothetical protein